MESPQPLSPIMLIAALLAATIIPFVVYFLIDGKKKEQKAPQPTQAPTKKEEVPATAGKQQKGQKAGKSAAPAVVPVKRGPSVAPFTTLAGHSGALTSVCFSPDGNLVMTSGLDRTCHIYYTSTLALKDASKHLRLPTLFDDCVHASFNAASNVVACAMLNKQTVYLFNVNMPGPQSPTKDFSVRTEMRKDLHATPIKNAFVHPTAPFVVSASEDTEIRVTGFDGTLLESVKTNQMKLNGLAMSPDGRFVAAAAFTGDVRVFELVLNKAGQFTKIQRAMELKGHKSTVYSVAFSANNKVVTCSKDGTWKMFDINVRYNVQEDPRLLLSKTNEKYNHFDIISISPDGQMVAAVNGENVVFFSVPEGGKEVFEITGTHSGPVTSIAWSPDSQMIATTGSDRVAKIWNRPV